MKNPFKIKRFKDSKRNVCAIYNKFFRVIKNSKGIYFYELADFLSMEYREFYKGKKTVIFNKYVIYIITIIFNCMVIPLLFLMYYPFSYFQGAKNFIKDTSCAQSVRIFNWINFISVIIFITYNLIKYL